MARNGGEGKRKNSYARRADKRWLLAQFGDGEMCMCIHGCGRALTFETVERDRIIPGASYRRENLQPSCGPCNKARSNNASWVLTERPLAALAA